MRSAPTSSTDGTGGCWTGNTPVLTAEAAASDVVALPAAAFVACLQRARCVHTNSVVVDRTVVDRRRYRRVVTSSPVSQSLSLSLSLARR